MRKLFSAFDVNDFLAMAGLGLLFYGLQLISLPLAYSVAGGVLLAIGLFGALRKGA